MPRMRLEWECNWQPRKLQAVQSGIQRMFSHLGGVSNLASLAIVIVDEDAPGMPGKPLLQLVCKKYLLDEKRKCMHRWGAEFFSECPAGHGCGRGFVAKLTPEEIAAEQAAAEAAAKQPPAKTATG